MIYKRKKSKLIFQLTIFFSLIIFVNNCQAQISLIKDIFPGSVTSSPERAIKLNQIIYFIAADSSHGSELWRTDGTINGTYLVKDINPGLSGSLIWRLYADSSHLYFFAIKDSSQSYSFWKSDGTESGTMLIKSNLSGPSNFAIVNQHFFWNCIDSNYYSHLWMSDGTTTGTYPIPTKQTLDTTFGNIIESFVFKDQFYFNVYNPHLGISNIWKTDGTLNGTEMALFNNKKQPFNYANQMIISSDKFYFIATDSSHGEELWISDGTDTGTYMIKDINPGKKGSNFQPLRLVGRKLYFKADDGKTGDELWSSDGTLIGTKLVKDISPGPQSSHISLDAFIEVNNEIYFSAWRAFPHLWKSDGTESGTIQLTEQDCDTSGFASFGYLELNDIVYLFSWNNKTYNYELWNTNGTKEGTVMIKDLNKVVSDSYFHVNYSMGVI